MRDFKFELHAFVDQGEHRGFDVGIDAGELLNSNH